MIQVSIVKYNGALEESSAGSDCDREPLTIREYKIEEDGATESNVVRTLEVEVRCYMFGAP